MEKGISPQSPPTGVSPGGSPRLPTPSMGLMCLKISMICPSPFFYPSPSLDPRVPCVFFAALTPDRDFPGGSVVKCLPAMQETWVRFLDQEDPLEKEMAIHSSTLALKIPWTEKPDRLQFIGSERVRTQLSDFITPDKWLPGWLSGKESACHCGRCLFHPWMGKIPWRRKWQHTPIFLPEEIPWTEEASGLQSTGSQR